MLSVVVWCCMWLCVISWWLKMSQVAVGCCKLLWDVTSGSRRLIDVVWCYHLPLSVALCCRLLLSADVVWCCWTPHVAVCCHLVTTDVTQCHGLLQFAVGCWVLWFDAICCCMQMYVIICHSQLHCAADCCCLLMWSGAVGCWVLWCDAACGSVLSVAN